MHLSSTHSLSTVQNTHQRGAVISMNFASPVRPAFPYSGITTAHPHPVAPFPPPRYSHSSLYPSPIPSSSLPHTLPHHIPVQPQPFYSLAMTHLPPNLRPRPLPHTLPTTHCHQSPPAHSILHRPSVSSSDSTRSLIYCTPHTHGIQPHAAANITHTSTSDPSTNAPRTAAGSRELLPQPIPLRQATIVGVTCNHCGNHLLVDISGLHYQNHSFSYGSPIPPPPPPISQSITLPSLRGSPHLWSNRLGVQPQSYNTLPWPPPPQTCVSTSVPRFNNISSNLNDLPARNTTDSHKHQSNESSSNRSSRVKTKKRLVSGGKSSSSTNATQPTSLMIPYRERKKHTTTYARQQLESEFATDSKPTLSTMGQLAMKLGVTKEFVKHWYSNRRQRQRTASRSNRNSETCHRKIPSVTHEITLEIPTLDVLDDRGPDDNSTTVIISASE